MKFIFFRLEKICVIYYPTNQLFGDNSFYRSTLGQTASKHHDKHFIISADKFLARIYADYLNMLFWINKPVTNELR